MKNILILLTSVFSLSAFAQVCGPTSVYGERIDLSPTTVAFNYPGVYTGASTTYLVCGDQNITDCADTICKIHLGMKNGYSIVSDDVFRAKQMQILNGVHTPTKDYKYKTISQVFCNK